MLALDNFTSNQCNLSKFGGDITGSYQFLTCFYGLGDNYIENQGAIDSTLGAIFFYNFFIDDILVASEENSLRSQKHGLPKFI